MKRKRTKVDFEMIKKLAFPKDGSKGLNVSEVAKELNYTREDVMKAMREWIGKRTYDPISRKWNPT